MKNIMKKAHELTKKIIKKGDDYKATFKLCLSFVHSEIKKGVRKMKVEDVLVKKGYYIWSNYNKKRIYMNNFVELAEKFGIDFKSEKAYSLHKKSFLKISMYYDLDNEKFYVSNVDDFMNKFVDKVIDVIRNFKQSEKISKTENKSNNINNCWECGCELDINGNCKVCGCSKEIFQF